MLIWVFRAAVLAACPAIVWFGGISPTPRGAAVGLAVGAGIVVLEYLIAELNLLAILLTALGSAVGIILARLVDYLVVQTGNEHLYKAWDRFAVLRYFAFATLGAVIALRKSSEFDVLDKDILKMSRRRGADMALIDLHAVIDGRVADVCETRFLTLTLVVPRFLQAELQRLANSDDPLRRARGRRGLDVLARLQEGKGAVVRVLDKDVPEVSDLDGKTMRLARDMGVRIITTDFNVNKVAALEGVICVNLNDLSAALKTVVMPGESLQVFVMKEGKEREQGVGYLDDGAMVVVEDGRRYMGRRVEATVTQIHQTSNGRMIFAKARPEKAAA